MRPELCMVCSLVCVGDDETSVALLQFDLY